MSWQKLKELVQSLDEQHKGRKKGEAFEKLVARLLELLLDIPFVVAKSGAQPRGDARSKASEVSIQAKNYSDKSNLRDPEIVGDINIVMENSQDLQVYVLAISRDISEQLLDKLDKIEKNTGLDIVILELTDKLSDLGALCVTFWEDIHHFFDLSDMDPQFSVWVHTTRDDSKTHAQIEKVQSKLEDGIQTQRYVQEDIAPYLLKRFSTDKGFNPINLSQAIDRPCLESQITNWWETEESPICCLEGKEGHGKSWLAAKWISSICENEDIVIFWLDSKNWAGHKSIFDLLYTCFHSIYLSYKQGKITKLQNKAAKIWRKTLIVLDGVNERNAIEAAQWILTEYFRNDESEWRDRVRFLLTTRPLDDYPDFENYLWDECHEISVDAFSDPELQEALNRKGLQLNDLPDSLKKEVARIPRYFQTCIRLRNQFRSFDAVTKEMVLWADLLDKIERTDPQIKQKFGWHHAKDAQEILSDLAKQAKWTNVDAGPQASVQLLERYFPDYREVRHDLEEQGIAIEAGLLQVKLSENHITLGWALYLANLFDCAEFTGIKDFAEGFQNALEPIPSEDLRTEALFVALQITAISADPDISQDQLSQKRAALMLAWSNSHNASITDDRLSFWTGKDPDAYAQVVELEFEHHNAPKYEEMLIEPLAKTWVNKGDQIDRLASRLKHWLIPTHSVNSPENRKYINFKGARVPRKDYDPEIQLSAAALSILSQRLDPDFLETLARCYEILESNIDRKDISVLMRWGYTEIVLGDLCALLEQYPSDAQLLKGICGLAICLRANLRDLAPSLEHALPKEYVEHRDTVEQYRDKFNLFIERIQNQERLLTGDSPEVNANRGSYGLGCLAVRKDLDPWCDADQNEIKKISHYISANPEKGISKDLIPWIAKYIPESYRKLSCNLKINALNPEYPPYKLRGIQELIFERNDCKRITKAILEMKECLIQGDDSSRQRVRSLTEILLFSAPDDKVIDWFEFLSSHESLRKSIFTPTLQVLFNELLPEPIVKLVQQKLETFQFSLLGNQSSSEIESEKITEEDFWYWIYLCTSDNDESTIAWAFENLKRRKSDLRTMTFCFLDKARLDSNRFLSEIFTDKEVRKHLFLKDGRFFSPPIYEGENSYAYKDLVSELPQEIVGSYLCSPKRRADLSRWGKELMERMCSILQGDETNRDSAEELRFTVNREVLQAWATHNTTDFLQLANKYFALLSKSGWYCRGLYDFMDNMLCLLLRFQPTTAMQYYRQSKAKGGRTIFWAYGGVETFLAQLWKVECCNSPEHRQLRRELLEECLNDEEIMFMTLAALVGGGKKELWNLVTKEYVASPYAKERNLGVSILPWFGTDEAIEKLEGLKSDDSSQWVREHAAWAYEVAQQERSCQEVYREALQTRDLFRISAVFEQMKPALSPTAQWWHRKIEKEEFGEDPQDIDPKLAALHYRFWHRWGKSSQTKSNIEIFGRKLREYCRGERFLAGSPPRIAPWWKPTSDTDG